MARLVLAVIAVICLDIAFVLYMAHMIRVDHDIAAVRNRPTGVGPGRTVGRPTVDTRLQASLTPPALENPPATLSTGHTDRVRSRTPRVNSIGRLEVKERRRARLSDFAYALRTSPKPKSSERSFGDYIVVYKTDISRPARSVTVGAPSIHDDNNTSKPKKNSVIAKLQLVYKKPWDLIKAIGSKLR
jgi:hypothetical protein